MPKKRAPRRVRPPRARGDVQAVVDETIALFHWLSWVADQIYGADARGATRRWVLRSLHRWGPQTVPQLARARAARRQSLQPVVDALADDALVVLTDNPAHARSPLVGLTQSGGDIVAQMDRVDARVLRAVGSRLAAQDLATTAATLHALRRAFETEMRWRSAVAP